MTAETAHPDNVLSELLDRGQRKDKAEKLQKLHGLCSAEYTGHHPGARDLSLANMSRLAEAAGLFKARTIYNSQSIDYVTLIEAWKSFSGPATSVRKATKQTAQDKFVFLDRIEDAAVRSLCKAAFAERDKLRAELNLLKSRTLLTIDMRPVQIDHNAGLIQPKGASMRELTDSERSALRIAIDEQSLKRRRLRIGEAGEILDELGRFVFPPGFATGIAKVIASG